MEHPSYVSIVERSWCKNNMKAAPYILDISQGAVKEMTGFIYNVSRLKSSLKAEKKQLRVWLQYACSVAEMLFLLLLLCSVGILMVIRRW